MKKYGGVTQGSESWASMRVVSESLSARGENFSANTRLSKSRNRTLGRIELFVPPAVSLCDAVETYTTIQIFDGTKSFPKRSQ